MKHVQTMMILVSSIVASLFVAASASAQVGNYTERLSAFGTWNRTASPNAINAQWTSGIEDSRWVISVWAQFTGTTNVNYFWSALDKQTGVHTLPQAIGAGGAITGFTGTLHTALHYRPGICFTFDATPANNGVAIALCADTVGGALDVYVHFLRIDPATSTTPQPVWQEHPLRAPVNVSSSQGESQAPSVACLDTGEMYVVWRETAIVGTIGGVVGLNPVAPTTNPSNLQASDIFVRRLAQNFPVGPAPAAGASDPNPAGTTINITESDGADLFPQARAGTGDGVYVAWATNSSLVDNVGRLGPDTGPRGGTYGAETVDVYLTLIRNSGTTNLQRGAVLNVSGSSGLDNFVFPPALAFNRGLGRVGVVWHDLTISGGIGGDAGLAATDNGQPPFPNEYDVFLRTFTSGLVPMSVVKVSDTTTRELMSVVTGLDASGWAVAWTESISPTDRRARQRAFDANLAPRGGIQPYPVQSVVVGGPPPAVLLWQMTNFSSSTVTIHFNTSGTPDNLRTGQTGSATNVFDEYTAHGEIVVSSGTSSLLQVASFRVNGANALDTSVALPNTIIAEVALRNQSPTDTMTLDGVVVAAPQGFSAFGAGPSFPVLLPPGVTQTYQFAFAPNSLLLTPGANRFSLSASAILGTNSLTATSTSDLAVTGTTGDLAGISVAFTLNPSTISNGTSRPLTLSVTITNGGPDPIVNMSVTAAFMTGIIPSTLASAIWTPSLAGQIIPPGGFQTFTANLTAAASIQPGAYRPGLTLTCDQGIRSGTVTAAPVSALTVVAGTVPGGGGLGSGGLQNSGGGCSLMNRNAPLPFGLLALATLGAALAVRRRRLQHSGFSQR